MQKFETVGISTKELIDIAEEAGIKINQVFFEMGSVLIDFKCSDDEYGDSNDDMWDNLNGAIKKHFSVERFYMFSADTDQRFPEDIMIILGYNPY